MMIVNTLESTVSGWLKNAPHLPKNAQKWLAENIWWLAIVSVVASIFGIFIVTSAILTYDTVVRGLAAGYYDKTAWMTSALLSLGFSIATTLLTAFAITPLHKAQKKGWDLLFMTFLISALSVFIGALVKFNPLSFIVGLLFGGFFLAIAAYLLYEIRSYFVKSGASVKTPSFRPPVKTK